MNTLVRMSEPIIHPSLAYRVQPHEAKLRNSILSWLAAGASLSPRSAGDVDNRGEWKQHRITIGYAALTI
jgi:hypothetical protein